MSFSILPQQSPIDLGLARPINYAFPAGYFSYTWSTSETGVKSGSGETVQIDFTNSKSHADLILPGQVNSTKFQLVQFHFHSESEHRVNGTKWPLELHVVHRTTEPDPWSPGNNRFIYLVVAIFLDRRPGGVKKNEAADKFFRGLSTHLDEVKSGKRNAAVAIDPVRPSDLLPDDPTAYWRYEGSLTTQVNSPNGGYVSWVVIKDIKLLDGDVLDDFIHRLAHGAKSPQDLDRRFVFFNPSNVGTSSGTTA